MTEPTYFGIPGMHVPIADIVAWFELADQLQELWSVDIVESGV